MLAHVHQITTLLITTAEIPKTREFPQDPGVQIPCNEKLVFSSKTANHVVTFIAPRPDARTKFRPKNREKHGQREILESRDIRQVPDKRRVEVQSQNRDLLIRDVCTCRACPKTFPRSLTTLEETRRCHSYFIRIISRTSSESDSSCNRVSNATNSVDGLISSKSS